MASSEKNLELNCDDFKCIEDPMAGELGGGEQSVVRLTFHTTLGPVAVKCFSVTGGPPDRRRLERKIVRELQIVQNAANQFIVQTHGWVKWPKAMGLVMEYLPVGSIRQFTVDSIAELTPKVILRMAHEIASAIAYMHNLPGDHRVVHGDLKPENVLLTKDLHCKVGDFGSAELSALTGGATLTGPKRENTSMTQAYAAPEKLKKPNIKPKKEQDTYSFGMLLYVLLTGSAPYTQTYQESRFLDSIIRGERPDTEEIDEFKEAASTDAKQIIEVLESIMKKCWQQNPSDRPNMIAVRDQLHELRDQQSDADTLAEVVELLQVMSLSPPMAKEQRLVPLHQFSPISGKFIGEGIVYNIYNLPNVQQAAINCGVVEFEQDASVKPIQQSVFQQISRPSLTGNHSEMKESNSPKEPELNDDDDDDDDDDGTIFTSEKAGSSTSSAPPGNVATGESARKKSTSDEVFESQDEVCDQCGMKQDSECCSCPRVVLTEYELGRKIQGGNYGAEIYVCTRKGSGEDSKKFAAKVMDPSSYTVADKEIKVLEDVHDFHHIVLYYGCHTSCSRSLEKVIVLELCGGDVDQLVRCLQKKRKSESYQEKPISQICGTLLEIDFLNYFRISLIDIFRQSVEGLKCLHGQSIVHRDMKPGNILLYKCVDGTTIIKISDFGLSRKIPKDASTYLTDPAGTESFTAPEYLAEKEEGNKISPTTEADIFSLGLCFYYIFTEGHHVYGDGIERYIHKYNICKGAPPTFRYLLPFYDKSSSMQSEAFDKDRNLTDEQRITACHLLRKMLQFKPDDRPTIADVQAHPTCWHGEEKKQMIVNLSSILKNNHPRATCHEVDIVDLEFEQFETSLIMDEEHERQLAIKGKTFCKQQQDSKRERFHITIEDHMPECLRHCKEKFDDLRDLYRIARNKICHPHEQTPDVQKMLKIEKGKEDWDHFLHEFFHAVPQHLINSYNFLEKHYPHGEH